MSRTRLVSPGSEIATPGDPLQNAASKAERPSIAVLDYVTSATNPVGSCLLRLVSQLSDEYRFTVFSVTFENPAPDRIEWVRIRVPRRPLASLFMIFHVVAPLAFWNHRHRTKRNYALVQFVESNFGFGDIAYAHFCHLAYLKHQWKKGRPSGMRRFARWLDHRLHAFAEPWVYRRARVIVAASRGLAREIAAEYPKVAAKIRVLPNCVDADKMRRPSSFDRAGFRKKLGINENHFLLAFVALGHFERKGLPLLLEALARLRTTRLKLLVIGGSPAAVRGLQSRCEEMRLSDHVLCVGVQSDVRPFLWVSDAFALPSAYEVFPLAALEAAAAGLPLVATRLHGVEEILRDGRQGYVVERNSESLVRALSALLAAAPEELSAMSREARKAVTGFSPEAFTAGWRTLYRELVNQ